MAVFAASAAPFAPDTGALRHVLATPTGCSRMRDVPVDWLDANAGTWRPTAIAQPAVSSRGLPSVHVYVPIDDGVGMAPVAVDELRLARDHADSVTRFWTVRYRMRLFRTLAAILDPHDATVVDAAIATLALSEAEMRDVWLTAYAHGVPPRHPRSLLRPSEVRILPTTSAEATPRPTVAPSPGNILTHAVSLYRSELARIQTALWDAGLPGHAVPRHPLCTTLGGLLRAASAELLARDPPGRSVTLDPAVWGT